MRYVCPKSGQAKCGICGTVGGHRYEVWVHPGEKVPSCPTHNERLERVR